MPAQYASRFSAMIKPSRRTDPLTEYAIQGNADGTVDSFVRLGDHDANFSVDFVYEPATERFESFVLFIRVGTGNKQTKVYGCGPGIPKNRWFLVGSFGARGNDVESVELQIISAYVHRCTVKPNIDTSSGLLYYKDLASMEEKPLVEFRWFYLSTSQFQKLGFDPAYNSSLPWTDPQHSVVSLLRHVVDFCWNEMDSAQRSVVARTIASTTDGPFIHLSTEQRRTFSHLADKLSTATCAPQVASATPGTASFSSSFNVLASSAAAKINSTIDSSGNYSMQIGTSASTAPSTVFHTDSPLAAKSSTTAVRSPSPKRVTRKRARKSVANETVNSDATTEADASARAAADLVALGQ